MALVKTRTSLIEVVTTQIRSHEHKDLNFTWQQGVLPYGEIIPQSNIYCYTIVQPNPSTQENLPITCTKKILPRSTSNREVVQSKERPCNSCETKDCCPLRPRQLLARYFLSTRLPTMSYHTSTGKIGLELHISLEHLIQELLRHENPCARPTCSPVSFCQWQHQQNSSVEKKGKKCIIIHHQSVYNRCAKAKKHNSNSGYEVRKTEVSAQLIEIHTTYSKSWISEVEWQ